MPNNLNPRELTWAALLARWVEFARAAVALPDDEQGSRWKRSVTAIIELQAVIMALGELDELPEAEKALGLDKAEIIIRRNTKQLHDIWDRTDVPAKIEELLRDAAQTLQAAALNRTEVTGENQTGESADEPADEQRGNPAER